MIEIVLLVLMAILIIVTFTDVAQEQKLALGRWVLNLIGWKPEALRAYEQLQLSSIPEPYTLAWYAENATRNMQMIEASKFTALELINAQRAIHGYEPLPETPQPEYEGMLPAPADWKPE